MKIVAISDLHNHFPKNMPKGDILTVSGDISFAKRRDFLQQTHHIQTFIEWGEGLLKNKTYRHIVWVAGNHDIVMEDIMLKGEESDFRNTLPSNIIYLRDSMVEIDRIEIYGTPFTTPFYDWGFNRPEEELDSIFAKIPEKVDIILSHGPAFGYNDQISEGYIDYSKLGSKSLLKHVKRVCPHWLFAGHIHSGNHTIEEIMVGNTIIKSVNVSLLDESYDPVYTPFQFETVQKDKYFHEQN